MNADDTALQKAVELTRPATFYRIYWKSRKTGLTHQAAGLFTPEDKDTWLNHLKQTEPGFEVWAEEVEGK